MATSAYTRARGQRASQMSRQSQSGGRCPAVHRCTLLGQHFHYAHLHCFLMNWLAKRREVGGKYKEILLAATKQVRSRLYHRGCFKVILFRLNINQIRLQINASLLIPDGSDRLWAHLTMFSLHCCPDLEYLMQTVELKCNVLFVSARWCEMCETPRWNSFI